MTKQILFIHSAGAQGPHEGSSDFVAFLQSALGADYELRSPLMPHPDAPDYAPWKAKLGEELAGLNDGAILIGHSLGGSVLLKYLSEEKFDKAIAGIFIVASPYWGADKNWPDNPFILQDDFASKLPQATRIFIYRSRDDEVVPLAHLKRYAEKLPQAAVRELDGRGHEFKAGSPEIIEDIRSL